MKTLRPNHQRWHGRLFAAFAFLLTAAAILGTSSRTASAAGPPARRAILVHPAAGPNGAAVKVDAVDRSKINKDLQVDVIGRRLWTDSAESAKRLRALISRAAGALAVKRQVAAFIMETGVEPDMIPVRGEEGKKLGTKGMVLIEGGEFTRTGRYYDSSGGGLTILNDGTVAISHHASAFAV